MVPRRSLQARILVSVLFGLGFVVLGLAALVFKITDESTRYALAERLALAQAIQQEFDNEILGAQRFTQNLAALPDLRRENDLQRLLNLADVLDAAIVIGADGTAIAAGRHGSQPARLAVVSAAVGSARIFPVPGERPGIGFSAPLGSGGMLLGQVNRTRLTRLLVAHPSGDQYMAQVIGPGGEQIAGTPLPPAVIGRHLALVTPLSRNGTAGVVMHAVPDHQFDHYVAYAPLATLPGWGVTLEQPQDVVVALPQRLRTLILTVGLLMLLVGGAVAWLDVRRVVMPLRALAREAERIGSGDLATPIRVRGQDEISGLADSLDRMRTALGDSLEEIRRREARARALHEVGTGILRSREDEGALDLVVGEACRLLAGDVALLCLYDAQTQRVRPAATAGAEQAILVHGAIACPPPEIIGCAILSREYRAGHLVAPVQAGATLLGWLCVGTKTVRTFTGDDRTLLESLGTLAALALENMRLRSEVRWLGTIQERERLARELHDGLAQALGVVYAYAQRRADDGSARRSLERIAEISSRAYEEVRQAIYGLRLAHHTDLAEAIGEYLREFTRQTGLPVELRIDDPRATGLPMETEVQAVRIVQEALANIWRHARATSASVRFALEGDDVVVSIEDDGVGFVIDPSGEQRRHFGLMTMRERAESVGGGLTIATAPGKGTQITARLPLAGKEVASWIRSG